MALLSSKDIARYALATGKSFLASCDEKFCGKLILATECYTVIKWAPRTDKLTFLSPTPLHIRCRACQLTKYPLPIIKKTSKGNKPLRTSILKLYDKLPKTSLDTKTLIAKFKRKTKFAKMKRKEFSLTLKALKKEKLLVYKDKLWLAPKKIKPKRKAK